MTPRIAFGGGAAPLDFAALRAQLQVPGDFSAAVLADATASAASVELPDHDATDIALVTVDPAGSMDLDQALHLGRDGDGYLVHYAIADVASFVRPGSATDEECQRRAETRYFPDARVPLHPPVLGEGAASLLPQQLRAAVLWTIRLDATGVPVDVDVRRARVRSRARLDYVGVQATLVAGTADPGIALLPEIGALRTALARAGHAIDLDLPEQQVEPGADGTWRLSAREPLPVEKHNAEISLLTGMCAATIMVQARHGILRTLPEPGPGTISTLRAVLSAAGVTWPAGAAPGDVLATLDRSDPHQVVLIEQARSLLRGAGYVAFTPSGAAGTGGARATGDAGGFGAGPVVPEACVHAGIGATYAHVTAPLRRLVDRYATEICLAVHAGVSVPAWVDDRLPQLPATMAAGDRAAHEADRAVVDATEAWLLQPRIGETFTALVLDAGGHSATISLDDPAVRARCTGANLPVGERVSVRLVAADPVSRTVRFEA